MKHQSSIIKKTTKKYFSEINKKQKFFPGKSKIPLAVPPYDWEEVSEALDSLLTKNTTMGVKVNEFEKKFASYVNAKYAVMVNSGSSANLLALSVLSNPSLKNRRIKLGDEIITPAVTWATTVYPIINIGAKPVFVDVDLETYDIDPKKIEKAITKKTKAILPVHLLGNPCNMDEIKKISKKHGLYIIEDSCEAHGARYKKKMVGSFGDIGTFSFFASHHITTMEGGMIVTNNYKFYELAKSIRAFGWVRDLNEKSKMIKKFPKIDSRFLFITTGFNMRPTEIQGAFGIHQIKKINRFIKIRIENANYWTKKLSPYSKYLILPIKQKNYDHSYMAYPITVKKNIFFTKNELVSFLEKKNIETRPVMAGNMVEQPVTKFFNYKVSGSLKNAHIVMNNSFLIGNHQDIDGVKRKFVSDTIINFMTKKIK